MKIGIKRRGMFGVRRIALEGKIEKIEKRPNPINPEQNGLTLFFKGLEGIGFIHFSSKEIEMLSKKPSADEKTENAPAASKKLKKKIKKSLR